MLEQVRGGCLATLGWLSHSVGTTCSSASTLWSTPCHGNYPAPIREGPALLTMVGFLWLSVLPALALISRGRAMCVAEATWADGRGPALRLRLMPGTWLLYSHMTVLDSVLDRQIYLSPCHGDMLGWLHRSCAIDTWLAEIRTQHRSD